MTTHKSDDHSHTRDCLYCGLNKPFDLPEEIIGAALSGSLVIFAGAGISTEVPAVLRDNIYTTVKSEVTDCASDEFPDVMSSYVAKYSRTKLIELIWNRFDLVRAFSELRRAATRFHRELATMPYIREIVTTNWDPYFEEECGAIPIVTGADYALRDLNIRRVYKIHGSINAISTLVATRPDYDKCQADLSGNALGATLRHLLATKLVVFVGYSLADTDFRMIYKTLTADLGDFAPNRYFVGPFESQQAQEFGMRQIVTDGSYFLSKLKAAIAAKAEYLPDSIYNRVSEFAFMLGASADHLESIDHTEHPGVLFTFFYQQGARHACDRILANRIRGEYSDGHAVHHKIHSYMELLDGAMKNALFDDAAYIEGYLEVLLLVVEDDRDDGEITYPPPYYCFSRYDLYSPEDLDKSIKNLRRRNRPAWEFAKQMSDRAGRDYIPQHGVTLDFDRILS